MEKLHPTQQKLLDLSVQYDLTQWGLRRTAKIADIKHPQQVKYHLNRLIEEGYLDQKTLKPIKKQKQTQKVLLLKTFLNIPIYGEVNCGVPTIFSEENLQGFIKVSKSILGSRRVNCVYALKADGNSMNRSNISNRSINDGDYVLVEKKPSSNNLDGKYVVASIDDVCTLKKVVQNNDFFKLIAESDKQEDYPPIVVHRNDMSHLRIEGEVFQVISNKSDTRALVYAQ